MALDLNRIHLVVLLFSVWLLFLTSGEEEKDSEETVTSVLGITGSRVALPCNITPPGADDAVALILWYKDDITKPIYSVDARKTQVDQARHVTGKAVSSRVSLSLDDHPSLLFLEQLAEEDEGEYRCRVDFRRARSRNAIVFLQLVVPPKKPVITDQNGEVLESLIGPYNEEDNLHLICEAAEGKPLPSVTWWRESVMLDDSYSVTSTGLVRNELEIVSLKRHDLMAVFTCQASNNNFSQPSLAAVTVDMNLDRLRAISLNMSFEGTESTGSAIVCLLLELAKHPGAQQRVQQELDEVVGRERLPCFEDRKRLPFVDATIQELFRMTAVFPISTLYSNFIRPVSVKLEGGARPMSAGRPTEVSCRSAGSKPPALLSWFLGSARLTHNRDTVSADGNFTLSVLSLRPVVDDNGKTLTCRAENPLIAGSAIDDSFELDIHYMPQLVLRLGSKLRHFRIQEGNDVYMECDIRANPWVTDISWTFEGRELHTNISTGLIISNQSLVLQRVQRANRGHYTCAASNTEGTAQSKPLYLSIQYSPVCVPGQKILYGARRHEEVRVVCEVEADPADVAFQWSFNRSGSSEEVAFASEGTRSTATLAARADFDYGTLTCTGSNAVGIQREPCVYTVITAGPPDPPQNCTASNITSSSFRVDCAEGANGGLRQHFVMEVLEASSRRLRLNTSGAGAVFAARDLPPAAAFVVAVYAANARGRSQPVVMRVETAQAGHGDLRKGGRWLLTSQVMVVVLSAVVLVFLLLAVAIVITVKTRRGDHKRLAKRNAKSSEAILKNAKEANRDMCIIVPDEDEKPPDIQYQNPPEVITMTNPYIDDLYCSRDSKPPSPYLGDYEKEEPSHRRENVFVRLHHSLTRRKKDSDEGNQLQTFGGTADKKSANSPHQSMETIIEETHNRWLPDVQAGLEPDRVHIITGMTTPC